MAPGSYFSNYFPGAFMNTATDPATMVLEMTQELISIGVIVLVCVTLSVSCICLWMIRCRRDQIRHREGKDDRQRELNNFEDNLKKVKTPPSKKKVHEAKKDAPKKQETDAEKGDKKKDDKKKEKRATGTVARTDETMQQFEARMKALDTIEESDTPSSAIRNKRVDTVSVMATGSSETLQRNDSKVNVFPVERIEEMDLNPGLNGPINLDAI